MSAVDAPGTASAPSPGIRAYPLVDVVRNGRLLLRARDAATWTRRLRGLQGHPALAPDEALIIRPCRSVQTWHMAYAIDVVFLNRRGRIVKLATLPPGGMAFCLRAACTIEMAVGAIDRLALAVNDTVHLGSPQPA